MHVYLIAVFLAEMRIKAPTLNATEYRPASQWLTLLGRIQSTAALRYE